MPGITISSLHLMYNSQVVFTTHWGRDGSFAHCTDEGKGWER